MIYLKYFCSGGWETLAPGDEQRTQIYSKMSREHKGGKINIRNIILKFYQNNPLLLCYKP